MATFKIDLPDRLLPGLQAFVARYNADNGAGLSVEEWLARHTAEIGAHDQLLAEQQRLTKQAQDDLDAALRAVRERLIEGTADNQPAATMDSGFSRNDEAAVGGGAE
jgi:hypothetical protein